MNTANIDYTNTGYSRTFHYFQRGNFKKEVKNIDSNKKYTIQEIYPNGNIIQTPHISGEKIKNEYSKIFQEDRHGFIVIEEGKEGKVIFVYIALIPDRVNQIISKNLH